jgi:hypothetical protein
MKKRRQNVSCATAPLTLGQGTIHSNKLQMVFHEEIQHFFALFILVISRTNMHRRHKGWSPSPSMCTLSVKWNSFYVL